LRARSCSYSGVLLAADLHLSAQKRDRLTPFLVGEVLKWRRRVPCPAHGGLFGGSDEARLRPSWSHVASVVAVATSRRDDHARAARVDEDGDPVLPRSRVVVEVAVAGDVVTEGTPSRNRDGADHEHVPSNGAAYRDPDRSVRCRPQGSRGIRCGHHAAVYIGGRGILVDVDGTADRLRSASP